MLFFRRKNLQAEFKGPAELPYRDGRKTRFWKTGASETDPSTITDLYKPKFRVTRDIRIATAGSCFAQHIGRRLRNRNFNVLDYEPKPEAISDKIAAEYGYGIYSARYGNIYLVRQLLQLAKEALGKDTRSDILWTKDGKFYDALRPGVEPEGLSSADEMLAHRAHHLKAVQKILHDAEIFIFTLGLTEGWLHRSGTVYPTAPGTVAGSYDPTVHTFKNFTFQEILDDFLAFRELARSINPGIRFLLTVSPVPLTATATNDHVLVATTYSKAVLRAVAGQLCQDYPDIDYFPSYELIATHWSKGQFFEPNLRNVSPEGVHAAMRTFFAAQEGGKVVPLKRPRQKRSRDDEVCEEAMLEAFNK
jgi:hypothetical protein